MKYQIYHATLAETLAEAGNAAIKAGAGFTMSSLAEAFEGVAPVNCGQAVRISIALVKLRGKTTRKHLQVSIIRLESGRYELTQYFL